MKISKISYSFIVIISQEKSEESFWNSDQKKLAKLSSINMPPIL